MYCPRCGQQQLNINSKFCSRCRFLMTGLDEVVQKGGLPKQVLKDTNPDAISPRKAGLKQGGILFLLGFIIVPILGILTSMMNGEGYFVGIAVFLTFVAGLLRMIYALFQSGTPMIENDGIVDTLKKDLIGKKLNEKALPPQQTEPIQNVYQPPAGNWRETADLQKANASEKQTKTLHNKTFQ